MPAARHAAMHAATNPTPFTRRRVRALFFLSKHEQHFLYLLGFARHWENASDDVSSFDDPSGLPISVR